MEFHAETRYLLCILIYSPWLRQESNNNNSKKKHRAVSKESLWTSTQPESSPGFFSEAVLRVLLYLSWVIFVSLFFTSSLFSESLFLQQFLLQIHNISSRMRRGEAALLLLGACAASLGCRDETAMVSTPAYVREIRATHLFSCNYIEAGNYD